MSLNYIPMSTPNIASIRKEMLVNIEDPIANRSLLDPDVDDDEETVNNDTEDQKLMDPDAHDYTGADIYRASLISETQYMNPSDLYDINHDATVWSTEDTNPSLLGKEDTTNHEDLLNPSDDSQNYTPHEVYGVINYTSEFDEYYNESAMKAKERNALDDSEFGIPRLRKYPLNDQKHVKFAIRMFGHCKDPKDRAELAKRIFAKVKEFDMDVKIGKGNPLYDYAPKSLQESIVSLGAEVPGIVSEEKTEKLSAQEIRLKNLEIAGRTANILNFQPALGKALGNLKEYEFLNYFYPDVKSTSFQLRMITSLGGMVNHPEIWKEYNLRPPLCTDMNQPLTHPNTEITNDQFFDLYNLYYNGCQNWFDVDDHNMTHIEYCLKLYSVMGMILLNPQFDINMLDSYWMGVLTDWYQHVQSVYDELMNQTDLNSLKAFQIRQQLWELCWNPTENPEDESAIIRNMIGFASSMVSHKFKMDLNESVKFTIKESFEDPNEFQKWMKNNIHYSEFTKMMTPEEVYKTRKGSCHDQVAFEYPILKKLGVHPKILFFIAYKEGDPNGGMTHSLIYWYTENSCVWFENSWGGAEGIRSYKDLNALKNDIWNRYKKMPDYKKHPELEFKNTNISKYTPGISLGKFVESVLNGSTNESGGELFDKNKCNEYVLSQLGIDSSDVYLLPDTMQYPILNQTSIRMAMDMIRDIKDPDEKKTYVENLNRKYKEFGCTFSISVDHPYAEYADQNIIDHMTHILSEGDTVVSDQGTSDAGDPDNAPWYVRSDVNGNVGQNLLQNKELGPNDKKNTALNIDPTESIIV